MAVAIRSYTVTKRDKVASFRRAAGGWAYAGVVVLLSTLLLGGTAPARAGLTPAPAAAAEMDPKLQAGADSGKGANGEAAVRLFAAELKPARATRKPLNLRFPSGRTALRRTGVYATGPHNPSWALPPELRWPAPPRHARWTVARGTAVGTSPEDAKYNWSGLLIQSLEFNVLENGFRLSWDGVLRDLTAHKPFWHDWISSLHQFNMRRWNDGDSFIVNYAGHTLQGAVGAQIEMQNSPTDSRIEWGDPGYVRSRFKALLWTTAFSTHSELSPLGEAGIGNEGGFTYGTQCLERCNSTNFKRGDHYTNNTGWVDFVVTPVVGMLWVGMEDLLDKKVSDRIQGDDRVRLLPKVIRGSLNPSRSFANALRGKVPWYREFQQPLRSPNRVHFLPSDESVEWSRREPRFQLAPHLTGFSIATNTAHCFNCRRMTTGAGVEFSTRLLPWLDADADVSYQPNASPLPSDRAGGNMLTGFFGLRSGWNTEHYALKIAVRPGFVRFDRAYLTSPRTIVINTYPPGIGTAGAGAASTAAPGVVDANGTAAQPALGDITHFAWNLNVTGDYKLTRSTALRVGVGEDLVRYRTDKVNAPGIGEPPYLSWLSKENFINRGSWSYQVGPVFSF